MPIVSAGFDGGVPSSRTLLTWSVCKPLWSSRLWTVRARHRHSPVVALVLGGEPPTRLIGHLAWLVADVLGFAKAELATPANMMQFADEPHDAALTSICRPAPLSSRS
ncbi:hypothetical protein OV090_11035 [Nannocystis sp. RBIL2]|uniref:hypothetical protein n=1 Tax=Nannocystis sp. RBIL2 TaxID=2996788 RepID=UPI0022717CE1|nr:hypothetical protein [Nannocystis sp. RBIL2]MCY1065299.1 hypothetical protein [Nannocystis sp. RBIL2]